jgi:phage terminase small subunit
MSKELTLNDWLFIGEYVKDFKPMSALRRAGFYEGKWLSQEADRIMKKPLVKAEIDKVRDEMRRKVQLNTQTVLDDILGVLNADPADIVDVIHGACRHCYGANHDHQLTHSEYNHLAFESECTGKPFNPRGGPGYNAYADPCPTCPECHGQGLVVERVKDVRDMTPAARALYMGAERTKNGLKINMRSKDAAREAAAKFLGLNKETLRVVDGKNLKDLSDDELEALARGEKV